MSKARRNSKGRFVKASSKKRRRNPKRRKRVAVASAPRRRRRRTAHRKTATRARRRRTAARRHAIAGHPQRRRRRNPRFSLAGIGRGIVPQLTQAGIGAAGALGLDILMGYIPLPDMLKTGMPRRAINIVGALGLGAIASKVFGQKTGQAIGAGALTVAMYGLVRELAGKFLPASIPGITGAGLAGGDEYSDIALGYMDAAPWIEDQRAFNAGRDVNNVGAYMEGTGAYMDENQGVSAYMDL